MSDEFWRDGVHQIDDEREVTEADEPELFHQLAHDREWSKAMREGRGDKYRALLEAGKAGRCPLCSYPMTEGEATAWHVRCLQSVPDPKLGGHPQNAGWSEIRNVCPLCVAEMPSGGEPYRGRFYRKHLLKVLGVLDKAS
jgi:rubrerythrin